MAARSFSRLLLAVASEVHSVSDLDTALAEITKRLGFPFYALSHHVEIARSGAEAMRLHNYPEHWAMDYDRQALGLVDPVHRASHVTALGFSWSQLPILIPLTCDDHRILDAGRQQGIGEGFTVPVHVPGEARGTCSFAAPAGHVFSEATKMRAQLAGVFAFETARKLWSRRGQLQSRARGVLTDRQRDCVLLMAQGKSDAEIAQILGISRETATSHIATACRRYRVYKRQVLITLTLFDGTLSFGDLKPWRYPHFL
ncbi:helix-turn-helix transcriptional regulator [Novosphingobium cyanobacteriorum]|uniref:Autoinducer binding domain-containing protein n=1 Tax=Novosphingobium cyanobacteriorum TaxID=3024215 RepID=A0ABT6CKU5_9SPHN|nr:autoinducer binding domain-containing protein [Novosphingobium cyanobacteriorum]MDF8333690.1 autoinducer binding domain-containing protein [Novosphingobium cyanobacteriorum]